MTTTLVQRTGTASFEAVYDLYIEEYDKETGERHYRPVHLVDLRTVEPEKAMDLTHSHLVIIEGPQPRVPATVRGDNK